MQREFYFFFVPTVNSFASEVTCCKNDGLCTVFYLYNKALLIQSFQYLQSLGWKRCSGSDIICCVIILQVRQLIDNENHSHSDSLCTLT